MTVSVTSSIAQIALWLQEQTERLEYADIGVVATIHGGEVRKVRYETTVKVQSKPEPSASKPR